jgi:hypothetical protein
MPDSGKWLAEHHVGAIEYKTRYRIEGWLAESGTSVWFGAGSTGKTQLMLWMAAMLASLPEDRPDQTWLGSRINGTGHVLILTAEDTREQIMSRLRDVVEHSMSQDSDARSRTCARLHVMPFLSMVEGEFDHPNPSLFQQDKQRNWDPTDVLKEVRRYLYEWNRTHPDAEERIIGVVMDSATSMSGFDSLDAQATTNFFFYLGRLCEELRIFWAIIGHTPKTTTLTSKTYRATAPSRLRGVAMWTTAPRLTVEVRQVQTWREGRRSTQEAGELLGWLPSGWRADNLRVVYVAKANLKYASKAERYLARQRHGAFVDVTDMPAEALVNGSLDGWEKVYDPENVPSPSDESPLEGAKPERTSFASKSLPKRGRRKRQTSDYSAGTKLTDEVLREIYPPLDREQSVSIHRLWTIIAKGRADEPRTSLVYSHSGGGLREARPGAINWHLDQLVADGTLIKRARRYFVRAR